MSADGVTFGQAISKARKGLGLSQKECQSALNIDPVSACNIDPPCTGFGKRPEAMRGAMA